MNFTYDDHNSVLSKLIKSVGSKTTKIYFGYPGHNKYAELAKSMSVGAQGPLRYQSPRGEWIDLPDGYPARPFIVDGYNVFEPLIMEEVEKYWIKFFKSGVSSPDLIGQLIVDCIKAYVESDPYSGDKPNADRVQEDKGYPSVPLIDSGRMIDSMSFVVTNRLEK